MGNSANPWVERLSRRIRYPGNLHLIICEERRGMTLGAAERYTAEGGVAPPLLLRQGIIVPVSVSIVSAIDRHERSLEGHERPRNEVRSDWLAFVQMKRLGKQSPVGASRI